MPKYFYIARDKSGKKQNGMIEAESNAALLVTLRRSGLLPIEIRELEEKGLISITSQKKTARARRISLVELALFSRQLATMLDAGISIIDSVGDLAKQSINPYFATILETVRNQIREGSGFSQALAKHEQIFSTLYVALVRSGEESGNLVEVMRELSEELEDQLNLIRKVRQAMSYPVIVSLFFVGVVAFVFLYLIPKFQEIFESFGAQLPPFTLFILAASRFSLKFAPILLILLILFSAFLIWYGKQPTGKKQLDTVKLKIPVLGMLVQKVSLARFCRSLSTLLKGGVGIISALEIVAKAAGNLIIEEAVDKTRQGVIRGGLLGEEMQRYKIFPPMLVRMVNVGEETGRTDDMLSRMSKFFRDEVDVTLNILSSIIEPILIIGLGFIVGVVVLAIYLPIFKLAQTMQ
ncbi:MAG: type II secretion system F family protein [Candidatus Ratteibacteria bacterium]|jgi:type IV pilus assembly protein PilC